MMAITTSSSMRVKPRRESCRIIGAPMSNRRLSRAPTRASLNRTPERLTVRFQVPIRAAFSLN